MMAKETGQKGPVKEENKSSMNLILPRTLPLKNPIFPQGFK
jgi:hypothetical protein